MTPSLECKTESLFFTIQCPGLQLFPYRLRVFRFFLHRLPHWRPAEITRADEDTFDLFRPNRAADRELRKGIQNQGLSSFESAARRFGLQSERFNAGKCGFASRVGRATCDGTGEFDCGDNTAELGAAATFANATSQLHCERRQRGDGGHLTDKPGTFRSKCAR